MRITARQIVFCLFIILSLIFANPALAKTNVYSPDYKVQQIQPKKESEETNKPLSFPQKLSIILRMGWEKLAGIFAGKDTGKTAENLQTTGQKPDPPPYTSDNSTETNSSVIKAEQIKDLLTKLDLDSEGRSITREANPDSIPVKTPVIKNSPPEATAAAAVSQPKERYGEIEDNPVKTTYSIAILGDSMVDTLGSDLEVFRVMLKSGFPKYSFALLNYGQGSTDLEKGLERLTKTTKYLDKNFPPLLSFQPDILVVESFAYNHWSGELSDINRQWITIAKIIDVIKEKSPKTEIILAATIGPDSETYADGKLNLTKAQKEEASLVTRAYLQNLINFANSQKYPLADAFTPSLDNKGNGKSDYINQSDHLHPSSKGAELFFEKILEAIKVNELIK